MKRHFVEVGAILLAGWALISGCASQTSKQSAKKSSSAKADAAPAKPKEEDLAVKKAASESSTPFEGEGWKTLFDGKAMGNWAVTDFAGHGDVVCEDGLILIESGASLSGINWTNEVPKVNYEIALDAIKLQGSDFFCGLTFPVKDSWCSLILGGWGGAVVGLSSIDDQDASENDTSQFIKFDPGIWHRVRVRVTDANISAWLDGTNIVNVVTKDKKIGMRFGEIELSKPLGIATYETRAAVREIKIRELSDPNQP